MKMWIIATLLPLLIGCASLDQIQVNKLDGVQAMTYNSNLRSIVVVSPDGQHKVCSEPPPDSSESIQSGVSAGLSGASQGEGLSEVIGESSSSLGGRNDVVLLARELLFRVCELGVNYDATYEQQASMFIRTLETIEKLSANESAETPMTRALNSGRMWDKAPSVQVPDRMPSASESESEFNSSDSYDEDSN